MRLFETNETITVQEENENNVSITVESQDYDTLNDIAKLRLYMIDLLLSDEKEISSKELRTLEELATDLGPHWLSYSAKAICAWFQDDVKTSGLSIKKAMSHDNNKTSLFFCLYFRRLGRLETSFLWLEDYLSIQDPHDMSMYAIDLLEALSKGLFLDENKDTYVGFLDNWNSETYGRVDSFELLTSRLSEFFLSQAKAIKDSAYPTLSAFIINWAEIKTYLSWSYAHEEINEHFASLMNKPKMPSDRLEKKLDHILIAVINEVPEGFIDFGKVSIEGILDSKECKISRDMQLSCIYSQKEYILDIYENTHKDMEERMPTKLIVQTKDFSKEIDEDISCEQLKEEATYYLDALKVEEIANSKLSATYWMALIVGVLMMSLGIPLLNPVFVTGSIIVILYWVYGIVLNIKRNKEIEDEYSKRETLLHLTLENICDELIALKNTYENNTKNKNKVAESIRAYKE